MTQTVHKAVFPAAGFGIRFLPVTKAMPKELPPVADKTLFQYVAKEAIIAGCDTLVFVTGRNKRAIEDKFYSNMELEAALKSKGKHAEAESVGNILARACPVFVCLSNRTAWPRTHGALR